jgi:hypothetical protein
MKIKEIHSIVKSIHIHSSLRSEYKILNRKTIIE